MVKSEDMTGALTRARPRRRPRRCLPATLRKQEGAARAALGLVRRIGKELLETGTYTSLLDGAIPFAEVNQMLERQNS